MDSEHQIFNPCCCMRLKGGALMIGGLEILYGLAYITRVLFLAWTVNSYPDFYPPQTEEEPAATVLGTVYQVSSYLLVSISGSILVIGLQCFGYIWALRACYVWLTCRIVLVVLHGLLCHYLIQQSDTNPFYPTYAIEVVISLIVHFYFMVVVVVLMGSLHGEVKTTNMWERTLKLASGKEVETFLVAVPKVRDITKASMYQLTPQYYNETVQSIRKSHALSKLMLGNRKTDPSLHKTVSMLGPLKAKDDWNEEKYRSILGSDPKWDDALNPEAFRKSFPIPSPQLGSPANKRSRISKVRVHAENEDVMEPGGFVPHKELRNGPASQLFKDNEYIIVMPEEEEEEEVQKSFLQIPEEQRIGSGSDSDQDQKSKRKTK